MKPRHADFGLAAVKREGGVIPYDASTKAEGPHAETFWFERSFTKAEYALLADALKGRDEPLLKDLRTTFSQCAVHGYDI